MQLKEERAGAIVWRLIKIGQSRSEAIMITGIEARKSSFWGKIVRRKWTSDRQAHKKNSIESSSAAGLSEIPVIFMVKSPARDEKRPGSSRERKLQSRLLLLFIKKKAFPASEYQRMLPAMQDNKIMTEVTPRIGISI